MADKDKYVSIADLKAKLRYWCKSRGASKQVQESLMETIKRIPYTVRADVSETLDSTGWIPCSEQMMPDGERVLMRLTNGEIFVMTRNKDLISDGLRHLRDLSAVTHWMPLPSPPESEVQE